jgi:hypothetical protein
VLVQSQVFQTSQSPCYQPLSAYLAQRPLPLAVIIEPGERCMPSLPSAESSYFKPSLRQPQEPGVTKGRRSSNHEKLNERSQLSLLFSTLRLEVTHSPERVASGPHLGSGVLPSAQPKVAAVAVPPMKQPSQTAPEQHHLGGIQDLKLVVRSDSFRPPLPFGDEELP